MTTRCRLRCHDLDCGADFFGDDLGCYRNSSISYFTYNDRRNKRSNCAALAYLPSDIYPRWIFASCDSSRFRDRDVVADLKVCENSICIFIPSHSHDLSTQALTAKPHATKPQAAYATKPHGATLYSKPCVDGVACGFAASFCVDKA